VIIAEEDEGKDEKIFKDKATNKNVKSVMD